MQIVEFNEQRREKESQYVSDELFGHNSPRFGAAGGGALKDEERERMQADRDWIRAGLRDAKGRNQDEIERLRRVESRRTRQQAREKQKVVAKTCPPSPLRQHLQEPGISSGNKPIIRAIAGLVNEHARSPPR